MSRNSKGQFTEGNEFASAGGRARAEKLCPEHRKSIARMGFDAMVAKHFGGNKQKATDWLAKSGQAAQDPAPWNGAFQDPGPFPGR